jgi:hypothetical protein
MEPASKPQTDDSNEYQKAFRKKVFTLLKMGYDRLETISFNDAVEEDITGEITRNINEILVDRSSPRWVSYFAVHEDPRINVAGRRGKHRQRVDIEFERVCHGPRPRYSFEAKRLCTNTHATMGEYMGSTGLGEFLSGNYARDKIEAGMLGYIQSDTPELWSTKALKTFKKEPEKIKACPDGNWTNVVIIDELPHCFRSKHHRISEEDPITIYHTFLVFC